MKCVIGIDFGNTLTYRLPGHDESTRQLFPYAMRVVQRFVEKHDVHIISKVNEQQKEQVTTWLKNTNFLAEAGIPESNLHFCAERKDKNKICMDLGVTHHIDDRPEVVANLDLSIKAFLFQPVPKDVVTYYHELRLRDVTIVQNWDTIETAFMYGNFSIYSF